MKPGRGAELAGLLLRAVVGSTMIAHGVRHGRGLEGTSRWFEGLGYREPRLQAKASCAVEVGAGAALLLGVATPMASSAVVGTMAVAAQTVHRRNGFFVTDEGYEYVLVIAAAATAVASLGGGSLSVDRLVGLDRRLSGPWIAVLAAGLGCGGAAAQLRMYWRRPGLPE
ncbi:DoxX family protein [Streptomyces sp. NPDC001978]|uniref:DoxX family protein n=1 Tax=Streptomyces sp. NPDC001978 TaxID=3364627 RepID=UPI0036B0545B